MKRLYYGHHEKFRNMREPAHRTHVLVKTGLLRPSGLRQFFEVPLNFEVLYRHWTIDEGRAPKYGSD
jgi:hypothetical protein